MKILLIYPEYPDTFWSFKHALKFVSKKAAFPPLGLITVASMLPKIWEKKLIDMNIEKLEIKEIVKADFVFISAMSVQYRSVMELIRLCKSLDKKIVAGGPLFTEDYEKFDEVDYLVLNEAEITLPLFLADLEAGCPKKIYQTNGFADLKQTPIPDYSLVKLSKYSSQSIQFSRGCPFNCEFCDITALLGHQMRTKSAVQIIAELDTLHNAGWRGELFFVDDNFIGNKNDLKNELLPPLVNWMKAHNNPFIFSTEASINLSDDKDLMDLMVSAGFASVFVGIETPQNSSLEECNKTQNKNRNLLECVKRIQHSGMEVTGGFIVGFDNDLPTIFEQQINFIQKSGIISAMIGLLNAPTKSKLYQRLSNEGRIISKMSGDNTDSSMNFVPVMDQKDLNEGYGKIIRGIYEAKPFYKRAKSFLSEFKPKSKGKTRLTYPKVKALIKSVFILGVYDKARKYYWLLFFWSLFRKPKVFPLAITYSIYGYHYRKVFGKMNHF